MNFYQWNIFNASALSCESVKKVQFPDINDSSLAEEIVYDTIFYLWEHRSEIEIIYRVRAYSIRTIRNRCLNELHFSNNKQELYSPISAYPIKSKKQEPDIIVFII